MPVVETCHYCSKVIDGNKENFIVVAKENGASLRVIAHLECRNNRDKSPKGFVLKPHL